jgi:Ca2+-binding RTX toxin-like protein
MGTTLLVAVGLATWLLPPTSAAASTTCVFDAGTGTVTIDVGVSETATIVRSGDALDVNGVPCDTATVTNTGQVNITTYEGSGVVLDLGGGPFAPGTSTTDDDPEIKFAVQQSTSPAAYSFTMQILGSEGTDVLAVGNADYTYELVNLDAGEATADADLTLPGFGYLDIETRGGNDQVSLGGGPSVDATETVDPLGSGFAPLGFSLDTGPGDDKVGCGGANLSTLAGGDGVDTIDCTGWSDWVFITLGDLGIGRLQFSADRKIDLLDFENIVGTSFSDALQGDPNDNRIVGGGGADTLWGQGGNDNLAGKAGKDTLAGGSHDDVLLGGSGDDRLDGGGGSDNCRGGPGDDVIRTCE